MLKLCVTDLLDHIYNWRLTILRTEFTQSPLSRLAVINATAIQGSVIGPPSFIVEASDLHPIYLFHALMNYVDDSFLLIGSSNISTATEEFSHISQWAEVNNLRLNPLKIRKLIVFKSFNRRINPPTNSVICCTIPPSVGCLSFRIDQVTSSCATSSYALRVLRSHGLPTPQLPGVSILVLVLKDSLGTFFKSLSLSWSLGVRSLSLSLSLGGQVQEVLVLVLVLGGQVLVLILVLVV